MSWVADLQRLHITIGATPQTDDHTGQKLDLDNELQMVKAALLYADQSTLCSVTASVFQQLSLMVDWMPPQRLNLIRLIPAWFPGTSEADQAKTILEFHERAQRRKYSKRGQEDLNKIDRALRETWPELSEGITKIMAKLGGNEILAAAESGFLNIHDFESPIQRAVVEAERRGFVEEYVSVVAGTVSDRETYALFDEETSEVIRLGIAAGLIPVSDLGIARGREVALAADLFKSLPLFPSATVMEILDIRRELELPLVRFRSAILKFSSDIKNAGWDEDFGEDAERVFRQDVAPAIVDLEESVESNSFLVEIANRIVPVGAVASSALALSISNLPNAALAALGIGAAVGSATIVQAYKGWAEKQQTAKQNQLYFYYRASQLLKDGSYRYVSERE